MRGYLHPAFCLTATLALISLLPAVARAQPTTKTLTLYYDSARTQRRAVYQARLSGARPDTVAHGPFRRFWRSGSLMELGHFTNGQADSIWTRYYPAPAGKAPSVARRLPMRAGQPEGPFVVYHPDGRLAQRGTFRQGQLVDSLVSRTAAGQARLLANFQAASGLTGSFRQWRSGVTAQLLELSYDQYNLLSSNNPYPRADAGRYWLGQLGQGRLVSSFSEYDPDGQPRVRLLYDSVGHLQMVTRYYPAAWRRNEFLSYSGDSAAARQARSMPYLQLRAVGPKPYLLQREWDWEADSSLGESTLRQAVGRPRHPQAARCGIAAQASRAEGGPLMSLVADVASFYVKVPRRPLPGAPVTPGKAKQFAPVPYWGLVTGRLPVPYRFQYWKIGETDTLTGAYRLLPRRVYQPTNRTPLEVETAHSIKAYFDNGVLRKEVMTTRRGVIVTRSYSENGQLESVRWRDKVRGKAFIRRRNRDNDRMPLFRRPMRLHPVFR